MYEIKDIDGRKWAWTEGSKVTLTPLTDELREHWVKGALATRGRLDKATHLLVGEYLQGPEPGGYVLVAEWPRQFRHGDPIHKGWISTDDEALLGGDQGNDGQ
jgi:hypothetical protein